MNDVWNGHRMAWLPRFVFGGSIRQSPAGSWCNFLVTYLSISRRIENEGWTTKLSRTLLLFENLHLMTVHQEPIGIESHQIHPFVRFARRNGGRFLFMTVADWQSKTYFSSCIDPKTSPEIANTSLSLCSDVLSIRKWGSVIHYILVIYYRMCSRGSCHQPLMTMPAAYGLKSTRNFDAGRWDRTTDERTEKLDRSPSQIEKWESKIAVDSRR
jgi:hypothetical protein